MSRRVVFTGLGVMSPNGTGKSQFWENTCNGVSGVRRISSFDPSGLDCQIAGEVQGFDPGEYYSEADLKKLPRTVPLGCRGRQGGFGKMPESILMSSTRRISKAWVC